MALTPAPDGAAANEAGKIFKLAVAPFGAVVFDCY